MPFPNPPDKIVAFDSGPVPPHDIGRQFDEHAKSVNNVIDFLKTVVRDDGVVRNHSVGPEQLRSDIAERLARHARDAVEGLLADVRRTAALAEQAAADAQALKGWFEGLCRRAAQSADAMAVAAEEVRIRLAALPAPFESGAPTVPAGVLGPNMGGPFGVDALGGAATAQDYSQVSIDWAEHMPDTIPPNTLAINAITGDHWSSRWWANRSANAFGMLAWWYQGAFAGPPPSTPNTPTGQPLPVGAMYYDTVSGQMNVWTGSTWKAAAGAVAPSAATIASLYYIATAGQTIFNLSTPDRNGQTFAFTLSAPEGVAAHVNGVRMESAFDFTVNTSLSRITFATALSAGAHVIFDLFTPVGQLTPSGTVNTVLLNAITPNGSTTVFSGLTVAMNGHPVNVVKNEELHVSVNGVVQQPGAAYNASGATITFSEAPEANANIFIIWFGPANP